MNQYQAEGYESRREYLESLAEQFDLPRAEVFMAAQMLGPNEDFDGLVTSLEDEAQRREYAQGD